METNYERGFGLNVDGELLRTLVPRTGMREMAYGFADEKRDVPEHLLLDGPNGLYRVHRDGGGCIVYENLAGSAPRKEGDFAALRRQASEAGFTVEGIDLNWDPRGNYHAIVKDADGETFGAFPYDGKILVGRLPEVSDNVRAGVEAWAPDRETPIRRR